MATQLIDGLPLVIFIFVVWMWSRSEGFGRKCPVCKKHGYMKAVNPFGASWCYHCEYCNCFTDTRNPSSNFTPCGGKGGDTRYEKEMAKNGIVL
jgi:hypothetical protein